MRTYQTAPRGGFVFTGVMFFLIGALFVVLSAFWLLGLATVNDKRHPTTRGDFFLCLIGIAIGSAGAYIGARHLWLLPYQIRIQENDTIEFRSVLRRQGFPISDIRAIDWTLARIGVEDQDARELCIRHAHGSVSIPYFDGVERFLDDVRARNPIVMARGDLPRND